MFRMARRPELPDQVPLIWPHGSFVPPVLPAPTTCCRLHGGRGWDAGGDRWLCNAFSFFGPCGARTYGDENRRIDLGTTLVVEALHQASTRLPSKRQKTVSHEAGAWILSSSETAAREGSVSSPRWDIARRAIRCSVTRC